MAAPLAAAAKLLIKPIINELKKAAVKKVATTGAAKAAGLGVREITKLTNLDILNLVRAKVVKGTKAEVAKSLGITVKELNATIADITLTETRKNAVKGANYIKNANRFLKDPIKSLAGQGKRKIAQGIQKETRERIKNAGKNKVKQAARDQVEETIKDEAEISIEEELLNMLKDELNAMKPGLADMLDKAFSENPEGLSTEALFDAIEKVQRDKYYEYKGKETVVYSAPEGRGGGYKMGYKVEEEFVVELNQILSQGFSIIPHDGGIL